jgi:hypothetical protein
MRAGARSTSLYQTLNNKDERTSKHQAESLQDEPRLSLCSTCPTLRTALPRWRDGLFAHGFNSRTTGRTTESSERMPSRDQVTNNNDASHRHCVNRPETYLAEPQRRGDPTSSCMGSFLIAEPANRTRCLYLGPSPQSHGRRPPIFVPALRPPLRYNLR